MRKAQNTDKIPQESAQNAAEQPMSMKVDVKISSIRPEGNVRAYASINLNDCFAIRNVKVVDSSKGLFIAMPSYKAGNGEYKDICFPITKEFREQLNSAVIDAYKQALSQSQQQKAADSPPFEQAPEQSAGLQMG
ncbi:TPA: SpoVG family protein [Enterococcus faecalis]|uniref:SpoVG family protein n=1 Tax=Bacilli TaxID=91061 RepID=UPI000C33D3FE|nr:SpoVG family protein [Macrococcus caseolyticus]HAP5500119.1 SpoVG family protein [Enterococcus faecalis]PKE05961.1 SpoVG family protein [Macrococcus caseolyticus]PKE23126.1 SpoVG family protein [Macrococcus caseolyticus]PKE52258.1 SpoVG family protein [Macrococcus caseolyticus]PKF37766.1 SpoVG family protein [Macrococcus caseolyticus]